MSMPKEQFMAKLAGVTDPEKKRKIIGAEFIEVFDAEEKKLTNAKWLAARHDLPRT